MFASLSNSLPHASQYRGRFAPSPSGPLHFGSLIAALASYLDAKAHQGLWFVRIEDIDQPRTVAGATYLILDGLEQFGLHWDHADGSQADLDLYRGCVVQSHRIERYQRILTELQQRQLVYACSCSRQHIKAMGSHYNGHCRNLAITEPNSAIRLKQTNHVEGFVDRLYGHQVADNPARYEDYIIKRRDGLFAYQFVVVVDDIDQNINHIVRGADIMPLTTRQMALYQLFDVAQPKYLHVPLACDEQGRKLSKQNHAPAINTNNPQPELLKALCYLGYKRSELDQFSTESVDSILSWAVQHWQPQKITIHSNGSAKIE